MKQFAKLMLVCAGFGFLAVVLVGQSCIDGLRQARARPFVSGKRRFTSE